jgi:1,4-alpha-glucan branching enzyme
MHMKKQLSSRQKQDPQGVQQNGIKKKYSKDNSKCQVTFRLPREAACEARCVAVAGNFNNWDTHAHRMKKLKNGDYSLTVNLAAGNEYEFRYVIDETRWENDWNADTYVWSSYSNCENSVVIT